MTVPFADVADFTAISKRLDPEEVHQIMGEYEEKTGEVIRNPAFSGKL